jgi:hypothetical protein
MVAKFQVAPACFSCNPPDFHSWKLNWISVKVAKIIFSKLYVDTNSEIKIQRPLSEVTANNQPNGFTFTLLLSEDERSKPGSF